MQPKKPRFNPLVIAIVLAAVLMVWSVLGGTGGSASGSSMTYSTVVHYFESNQVTKFSLDLNTGVITMTLKEGAQELPNAAEQSTTQSTGGLLSGLLSSSSAAPTGVKKNDDGTETVSYKLPYARMFVDHVSDYIAQYDAANPDAPMVYDYVPAKETIPWMEILFYLAMLGCTGFLLFSMMRGGAGGGGIMNVGKAKAQVFDKDNSKRVTFKDVAGLEEAKVEIMEIVDFLKKSDKYKELGAKIPKGALLVGPPGTGKTLLAKAVAGEANVPFLSISGSDFVEMFVGVGASRVRDLFEQAKQKAPCIVFIDEIDAIGRARGKNAGFSGNDERENTLNQLLTEMDGFQTNTGVIVLAATNRADILDKALMRAGRFDRQIEVGLPDVKEREEIFNVHLRPLKLDPQLDRSFLARQTPGFSGADIANVCNEAALIAARHNKKFISKEDFLAAIDRIVGGLERKNKIITDEEKRVIAYHEAGHATVSWILENASPLIKVTIIPRGKALGAAWYLPEERQITTREQMMDELAATLGGRVSEQLTFGEISTGALNDLERVTKQAYAMVAYYGMSENVGTLSYYDSTGQSDMAFTKPYSELTAQQIDAEAKQVIEKAYKMAETVLREHADGLKELAELLLEREVVFTEDVERIFGRRKKDILREQKEAEAKVKADGAAAKGEPEASAALAAKPAPEEGAPAVVQTETPEAPADGNTAAAISKTE